MEKWSKAHHMFEAPEAWAAWWEDASRQWKLSPRHTPGLQPALQFSNRFNWRKHFKQREKVHMHCTSRQRYDKLDLNNSHNLNILLLGNWAEASADDGAKNQWKEKSKSYHCQHILAGRQNNKKLYKYLILNCGTFFDGNILEEQWWKIPGGKFVMKNIQCKFVGGKYLVWERTGWLLGSSWMLGTSWLGSGRAPDY